MLLNRILSSTKKSKWYRHSFNMAAFPKERSLNYTVKLMIIFGSFIVGLGSNCTALLVQHIVIFSLVKGGGGGGGGTG